MEAARCLVKGGDGGPVAADELAAFGLVAADTEPAPGIPVWPENWKTVEVFVGMGTQWNVGMGGVIGLRYEALPAVIGLRYEALPAVMRYCGVAAADRAAVFAGLRHMESAALGEMNRGR